MIPRRSARFTSVLVLMLLIAALAAPIATHVSVEASPDGTPTSVEVTPTDSTTTPETTPEAPDATIEPTDEVDAGDLTPETTTEPTTDPVTVTPEPEIDAVIESTDSTEESTTEESPSETGDLIVYIRDAAGNSLPASCLTYTPNDSGRTGTLICDGVAGSEVNDGVADGAIEIHDLQPGKWVLKGYDASESIHPAPLPVVVLVVAGRQTPVGIYTSQDGAIELNTLGAAGSPVSACAILSWGWGDVGGNQDGPLVNKYGRACDGDDGSVDGKVHFTDVPTGTYWITPTSNSNYDDPGNWTVVRATVRSGETATATSYFASAKLTVHLSDADTGQSLPQFEIEVLQLSDDGLPASYLRTSDRSTLTLPPGTYRVRSIDPKMHTDPYYNYDTDSKYPVVLAVGQQTTVDLQVHYLGERTETPEPEVTPTQTTGPEGSGAFAATITDAVGNPLGASCLTYAPIDNKLNETLSCDNSANTSANDDAADGVIRVAGLAPGKWILAAIDPAGRVALAPLPVVITIEADATTNVFIATRQYGALEVHTLGAAGSPTTACAWLSWDLRDSGGEGDGPLANKYVRACDGDDGTVDGVTHFAQLPVGTYWITPTSDNRYNDPSNWTVVRATVRAGETAIATSYYASARLTVTLSDAETGESLPQFEIEVLQLSDDGLPASYFRTNDHGTLTLAPGTYRVRSIDPNIHTDPYYDYDTDTEEPVVLTVGSQHTVNLTVNFLGTRTTTPTPVVTPTEPASGETGAIAATITGSDGNGLAASCVTVAPIENATQNSLICDGSTNSDANDSAADGVISITGLQPGTWLLTGIDPNGGVAPDELPVPVTVVAGETTDVTIAIHRYGSLEVHTFGVTGAPTTGCAIISWDLAGQGGDPSGPLVHQYSRACDGDDGSVDAVIHFDQLPAGIYWITPTSDNRYDDPGNWTVVRTTVIAGEHAQVASFAASAKLTVTLSDADTGDSLPQFDIEVLQLADDGSPASYFRTNDHGTLTLAPGTYRVRSLDPNIHTDPYYDYDTDTVEPVVLAIGANVTIDLQVTFLGEREGTPEASPTETPSPPATPITTATSTPNPTATPVKSTLKPSCTIADDDVVAGDEVSVRCRGFQPRESVAITWDHSNGTSLGTMTTNKSGSGRLKVIIPVASGGAHRVVGMGELSGVKAVATVTIRASMSLSTTTGKSGDKLVISGHGFTRGEIVTIRWVVNGSRYETLKVKLTANRLGEVSAVVAIPQCQSIGTHKVMAMGDTGNIANGRFRVRLK